jgi:hypothetical protein
MTHSSPLGRLISRQITQEEFRRESNEKRKRNGLPPLVIRGKATVAEGDSAEVMANSDGSDSGSAG